MLGNHLLGLYEKALPAEMTWRERLTAAAKLGFEFVELSLDETEERLARLSWSAQDYRTLHSAMEETGLRIMSVCLSAHRRFPFGSADPAVREQAKRIAGRSIQLALEIGVRVIQVAGYDVYYEPPTAQSRTLFLEGLSGFVEEAEKHQVMLAMEIMDTDYISSISAYQAVKSAIPSPWLAVYPDLGNLSAWNADALDQLERAGREIVAVHLKDTIRPCGGFAGQFKCVPFGTGCVDFAAAFQKLEKIDFRGPYLLECWHSPGTNAPQEIASALAFLRRKFEEGVRV